MLVILGCALPVVALLLTTRHGGAGNAVEPEGPDTLGGRALAGRGEGSDALGGPGATDCWEGLAEELARIERQPRRHRRSDAALRRRHLAAVLPADARR